MKRRKFIALIGCMAIAWPLASYAQEPNHPLKRVGVLIQLGCPLSPDDRIRSRLGELGWVEGKNFVFDCVSTLGHLDQVPALARELVSRRPDVLAAGFWHFVSALKQETTTIPIVMLYGWEPVRTGLITSFAQPGGNVTGVAWLNLFPKQMELLKEIVPNLKRVAWLSNAPSASPEAMKITGDDRQITASTLGFTWQIFRPAVENDYDEIFARLATEHFDAVNVIGSPYNNQNATRICQLALRHRIPAVSETATWAKCGLLLTYGQDVSWTAARGSAAHWKRAISKEFKRTQLPSIEYRWSTNT